MPFECLPLLPTVAQALRLQVHTGERKHVQADAWASCLPSQASCFRPGSVSAWLGSFAEQWCSRGGPTHRLVAHAHQDAWTRRTSVLLLSRIQPCWLCARIYTYTHTHVHIHASTRMAVLHVQRRTPSRPSTPISPKLAASSAPVAGSSTPAAPPSSPSGLEDLAAWISANYMGMGARAPLTRCLSCAAKVSPRVAAAS